MNADRISVRWQRDGLRTGDEPTAIDRINDFMQGDHHLPFSIANHLRDGIRPRVGGPGQIAVMKVVKADAEENELSLKEGFRLLSVYHDRNRVKFWIISEADRSSTTILLPEDY